MRILESADRIYDDFPSGPIQIAVQGSFRGEPLNVELKIHRDANLMDVNSSGLLMRFSGFAYAVQSDATQLQSRNFDPRGAMGTAYDSWLKEARNATFTPGTSPDEPIDPAAYRVSCIEWKGVKAVKLASTSIKTSDVIIAETTPPFRMLETWASDSEARSNVTAEFSYARFQVQIDPSIPKQGPFLQLDDRALGENENGGLAGIVRVGNESHWTPLSDLESHLVTEDFDDLAQRPLTETNWTFENNFITYRDLAGHGYLSPGDEFVVNLEPGVELWLYDTWAEHYALDMIDRRLWNTTKFN